MRPLPQVIDDALEAQAARQRDWPWLVSDHAAERYRDRVDRSLTPFVAKRLIGALLRDAELLPTTTFLGQQRWLLPGKDAVVVCRPDPKMKARVAVTVLGPHEMYEQDAIEEVREAFERVAPSLSPTPKPAVVETSAPEPTPALPAPRQGLVVVRRASPSTSSAATPTGAAVPPETPAAKPARFNPWEQAYRALEKRYDALKAHLDRQASAASAARRDPDLALLRQQLQENQEANRRWKARAHAAEAKLLGAMAEPFVEAPAPAGSVSAERLQRAVAHALHSEEEAQRWRKLMRVAVLALRAGDCAAGLAALEAARPGITGEHFCYPERFTKAERKAATVATVAAEAAAVEGTPAAPPPPAEGLTR